jgi:transposase
MSKRSAKTHKLPDVQQGSLLDVPESRGPRPVIEEVHFEMGDRARLFVGAVPLYKYLKEEGLSWVLRLGEILSEVDWKPFEASYRPGGRPPLHPRLVMGLILYGMMLRQPSLRQLEALARRDVGAWWLSGGLTPDFTTFTKFIKRHREVLSDDFFVKTTWLIAKRLKLGKRGHDIGIDGTVMQAASSTATALKKEALAEEFEAATQRGDDKQAAQLGEALEAAKARAATREAAGKDGNTILISPMEPEAVFQPQKGTEDFRLSYKPNVAAHPSGLIVGQDVTPASEVAAVPALLTQHERIFGAQPERVLADAGYSSLQVLALFVRLGIDALIPSNKAAETRKANSGLFHKCDFPWDEAANAPRCPAELTMAGGSSPRSDRHGNEYRVFTGRACATCPLRERCTTSKQRRIKVFKDDELKVAMAQVMSHPEAKKAFRRRSTLVEPVFARLRANGLSRFRRRGRANVRVEFSLYCVAHNLRLLLWGRRGVFVAVYALRRPGDDWAMLIVVARN